MEYKKRMSKKITKVVLLHGFATTHEKKWFPWLRRKLEAQGLQVESPTLPEPFVPNFKNWMAVATPSAKTWSEDTLVIGHSLGGVLALRLLEKISKNKVGGVILVGSPFCATINVAPLLEFFNDTIDWKQLQKRSRSFFILHAKNDPMVPYDHSYRYQESLNAKHAVKELGGHFTGKTFPLLLEIISDFLQ